MTASNGPDTRRQQRRLNHSTRTHHILLCTFILSLTLQTCMGLNNTNTTAASSSSSSTGPVSSSSALSSSSLTNSPSTANLTSSSSSSSTSTGGSSGAYNVSSSSSTSMAPASNTTTVSSSSSSTTGTNSSSSSAATAATGATGMNMTNSSSTASTTPAMNATSSSSTGAAASSSSSSTGPRVLPRPFTAPATGAPFTPKNYTGSQQIGVQNIPFSILCASAPWSARYGHAVVSSGSTVLLIGGISWWNSMDQNHTLADIWNSTDYGLTWTRLTDMAPFGIRQGATSVLVNSAILLIGGETLVASADGTSDVWSSADVGQTWTQVSTGVFSSRSYHTSAVDVSTNTLIVIGGLTSYLTNPYQTALNDVWVSLDSGVTWSQANAGAPFSRRYGAVSFWRSGIVYMLGGVTTDGSSASDLWYSSDSGSSWIPGSLAGVGPRAFLSAASFAGNIYVLGGAANTNFIQVNSTDTIYGDVWMSADAGVTWSWQESTGAFGPRAALASVVSGNQWLIFGGINHGLVYNDIYRAILPAGNPNADGGVVAGILGASAAIVLFVLISRACIKHCRGQARRRREKAQLELAAYSNVATGGATHEETGAETAPTGHH